MLPYLYIQAVRRAARTVLERFGRDHQYKTAEHGTSCMYVPLDDARVATRVDSYSLENSLPAAFEAGCLVGEILSEMGLLTDAIAESSSGIAVLIGSHFRFDPEVAQYLRTMQSAQDSGKTWGTAFDLAEYEYFQDNRTAL